MIEYLRAIDLIVHAGIVLLWIAAHGIVVFGLWYDRQQIARWAAEDARRLGK